MVWSRLMRGMAEEIAAPKYAHLEVERRFVVDPRTVPPLEGRPTIAIEDRYIDGTRMRLRRMTAEGRPPVLKLTRKYESEADTARPVATFYLTEAEHSLIAALPAAVLRKRRSALIDLGEGVLLDRFEGALDGLIIVEVEGDAVPPAWLTLEVTGDPAYSCASLARYGKPKSPS